MTSINSKRLHGIPVVTRGGQVLGKLQSFDVDADTGHLLAIHVATSLVKGLLNDDLVIAWSQVVEMGESRVIVSDTSIPSGAEALAVA